MLTLDFRPQLLLASDFTPLLYFFVGIATVVAFVLSLAGFVFASQRSVTMKAIVWGFVLALVFTPTQPDGGSGTSSVVVMDILRSCLGGDSVYGQRAFLRLAATAPTTMLLLGLILFAAKKARESA